MTRWLAPLVVTALLTACATVELVEKSETNGPGYSVTLPLRWVRMPAGEATLITHDGLGLQSIGILRRAADASFPRLKKGADEKLLPSELAELQIAELKRSGENLAALDTLENAPALVGGKPGFRIHLRFRTSSGLVIEQIQYGVVQKGHYYLLTYAAPSLYYFPKYQAAFDQVVASFRLL